MTQKTRWEQTTGRRGEAPAERPTRREPAFWEQMRALAEQPAFNAFLGWLGEQVENAAIDPANPNAGALLLIQGRRSLHRVAEGLSAKAERELKADDRGDGSE